ncbi:MAG: DNA primase, partial [Thermoproteota archaeon]|nr:DNA primase [Thermoproteota archaeon]
NDYLRNGDSDYQINYQMTNHALVQDEALTFIASLLIIKSVSVDEITKKFALMESMRFEKYLIGDLKDTSGHEKKKYILFKIFKELFHTDILPDEKNMLFYKIRIRDYIKYSVNFHEHEWKLVNRSVYKGFVHLNANEIVRLFRNELSLFIIKKIKEMKLDKFPVVISQRGQALRDYWQSNNRFVYSYSNNRNVTPPCIDHLYAQIEKGENLPHSARLLLGTFLLSTNKSVDEIVNVFSKLPDFNERVTRYQLDHLAGKKGSARKYNVPSCEKIKLENLCHENNLCKGISNPIQLTRRRYTT